MYVRLKKIKDVVKEILEENFEARDNDQILYYEFCKKLCEAEGYEIDKISFKSVMFDKVITFPNYESVSRCRRKLQENDTSLWGERREERMALADDFRESIHEL